MVVLKLILSIILIISAILLYIYNEKERAKDGIDPSVISGYASVIGLLGIAIFLFFSIFDGK